MTATRRQIKVTALALMLAGISMGNESCEKANSARVLKMEVEVGSLKARPITLPTGETIDFPYVVNSLFYRQVMNNDHFVIANAVPSPASIASVASARSASVSSKAAGDSSSSQMSAQMSDVSALDQQILNSFGFLKNVKQQAAQILSDGSATAKTTAASEQLPACLYDLPQAQLGGEVISFEATWGAGLGIGYGANGSNLPGNAAGQVDFSQSKLEMGLRTDDPLTMNTVAIADGVANQSKVKFNASFVVGIPLGLNFFFNTPLSDVIRTAMDRGLDKIVENYKTLLSVNRSWDDVWESRVIYDPVIVNNDTHIAFRGGYRAGMQVGDKFTVTNLHYMWEGAACYTRLKYKIPLTTTPIAEVEIISVGDNVAVAQVSKYLIEQKIKPGALVKILALKQPVPAKTKAKTTSQALR